MKKKALVFLAPGFEEIEAVTVIDILRRAGIAVEMVGVIAGPIKGSRGISVLTDLTVDEWTGPEYDMLVFPGGWEGTMCLKNDKRIQQILEDAVKRKKGVAAICAAPLLLTDYLAGKNATSHPSVRASMSGVHYREENVVTDGFFVTSRAPGTAMAFAFELVRILAGEERVRAVNAGVMANLQ